MNQLEIEHLTKYLELLEIDGLENRTYTPEKAKQLQRRAARFISKFVHSIIWGVKKSNRFRPANSNRQYEAALRKEGWTKKISQKIIIEHLTGKITITYTSRHKGEILVCLDLDNHGKGSIQEGERFFRHLRSYKIFENLYWEESTSGTGLHAYLIITPNKTGDFGAKYKNDQLKDLNDHLRFIAEEGNFGIGDIEVKGTITDVRWNTGEPKVVSGQPIKIPRNWKRFSQLEKTCRFSWSELSDWKVERLKEIDRDSRWKGDRLQKDERIKSSPSGESPPSRVSERRTLALARKKNPSVTPISKQWIGRIPGFQKYTQFLIDDITRKTPEFLRARGRRRITQEDLNFALALIGHLSQIKKKSGETHMPHNLIEKTWDSCFESGIVSRVWDNSRWAKIRQIFSHYGLIEWKSSKYHFFAGSEKKGKACEWRFSDAAVQGLIELAKDTERDSFVNTVPQFHSETITKSIYDAVRPVLIYPIGEIPVWKPDKELPESIQRVVSRLVCV